MKKDYFNTKQSQLKKSQIKIKRLEQQVRFLIKEIAEKDSIIKLQSETNKLLISHLQDVIKLENAISKNNLKISNLLEEKIVLQ